MTFAIVNTLEIDWIALDRGEPKSREYPDVTDAHRPRSM
jgi:hypothetical protein